MVKVKAHARTCSGSKHTIDCPTFGDLINPPSPYHNLYEIREGDGNEGTFLVRKIWALNMDDAVKSARDNEIKRLKPYYRKQIEEDGDDEHATLWIPPTHEDDVSDYVLDIIKI